MHFSVPDLSSAAFWGALWKIMIANVDPYSWRGDTVRYWEDRGL